MLPLDRDQRGAAEAHVERVTPLQWQGDNVPTDCRASTAADRSYSGRTFRLRLRRSFRGILVDGKARPRSTSFGHWNSSVSDNSFRTARAWRAQRRHLPARGRHRLGPDPTTCRGKSGAPAIVPKTIGATAK